MNSRSRGPRQKNAGSKNERGPKMRLPVTEQPDTDAIDLDNFINARNKGKTKRDQLSNIDIGRLAGEYGGARHGQVWSDYRTGKRRIPARDKVLAAFIFDTRPERIFRSWPRKFKHWSSLIEALGDHSGADTLLLLAELIALFANVTDEQRAVTARRLRQFLIGA